jgi:hypothetical protein
LSQTYGRSFSEDSTHFRLCGRVEITVGTRRLLSDNRLRQVVRGKTRPAQWVINMKMRQGLRTFHVHTPRARERERERVRERVIKHSLIYGRIFLKFAFNILQITPSSMGYLLLMFTHREHACERGCVSARVAKHSHIFGRILLKFAGHILQMTTRYMGYTLIMFAHRGHVCERACVSARVIKLSLIYGRFLFKFAGHIL